MPFTRFEHETSRSLDCSSVLVVGLGATEQHGPHLPLGTDTIVADALVDYLCEQDQRFVAGPTFPIGASGEHQGFLGTLSLGTDALAEVLVELVRSARESCAGVYFVSGHGGNLDAVRSALKRSQAEGDRVGVTFLSVDGGDAHAGHTETSLLLHLRPELVTYPWERGANEPVGVLLDSMRQGGVRAVSENGVLGDPTGATAQAGAQLFEQMGGRLLAEARTWLEEST